MTEMIFEVSMTLPPPMATMASAPQSLTWPKISRTCRSSGSGGTLLTSVKLSQEALRVSIVASIAPDFRAPISAKSATFFLSSSFSSSGNFEMQPAPEMTLSGTART